jgi:DNA polymerase-1
MSSSTSPRDLTPAEPDVETLRDWYERIESRRLLASLATARAGADAERGRPRRADYELVLDEAELDAWVARLEGAELFAFDTETTSLDYMRAEIVGVSFAVEMVEAAYVPVAHDYPGAPDQLDRDAGAGQAEAAAGRPAGTPRSARTSSTT